MSILTNVEKEIVHKLQYHITMGKKVTLANLAQECHVAQSTIVKMSKKMGYSGFVEMYYQMRHKQQNQACGFMQDDLIEGDMKEVILGLVEKLQACKSCKHIISTYGKSDILSTYLSRKLGMFDIFAPATYDYVMAEGSHMEKGIAFFCDIRKAGSENMKEMAEITKREGYYMVVFSEDAHNWLESYADVFIQIRKTPYKTADFYCAKVLMFFEILMSEYARAAGFTRGDGEDGTA